MSAALLSDRQVDILAYVTRCLATTGIPPTLDEIGGAVGLTSRSGVHANVRQLVERGLLRDLGGRRGYLLPVTPLERVRRIVLQCVEENGEQHYCHSDLLEALGLEAGPNPW